VPFINTYFMEPTIVVKFDSIKFSSDDNATGIIFWEMCGIKFPEDDWNDFLFIVFEWWLDAVIRILRNVSDNEMLRFMDGPFWVNLEAIGENIKVMFVDGRNDAKVVSDSYVRRNIVMHAVLKSALSLVYYCDSHGYKNDHINNIQKLTEVIRKQLVFAETSSIHNRPEEHENPA
jgi:hypothetical protein